MRLPTVRRVIDHTFVCIGAVLTIYIVTATLGWISNSSQHYTNFVLATLAMAGLLLLRNLLDERISGNEQRFWQLRLIFAIAATVVVTAGALYLRVQALHLESVQPFFDDRDFYVGLVFLIGVLLVTLYHWGWILTTLIILAILYFFFGHHIENPYLTHPEFDANFVMNYMGLGLTDGMFWLAQLAADQIYFLVIFAAMLLGVGMLRMVIEIGKLTGNYVSGGASFPAIIGSGIVASVMGQAVSNVVLTGRLTIPMMKNHGFRPAMAGAIEAVASTSGQIMPPILGLAGFIIAARLNVAYIEVAMAALIPALLFLSGMSIGVLVASYRERLPILGESIDTEAIRRLLPTFLASFAVVLFLLVAYYSPAFAGLAGIIVALVMTLFQGKFRPSLRALRGAFEDGLEIVTLLSLLLIAIGPLAQTFLTTGLASRLGIVMSQILPDSALLMLFVAMVISLLLGMGLPTPVAYIVVSLTLVPFLQQIGVEALLAHFFVFYFAVFSTLTPPVAVSALAAAKLSGATFFATAIDAMKLMLTCFIIPFGFVFHPELMSFPNLTWSVIPPVALLVVLQITTAVSCYGYMFRDLTLAERGVFGIATLIGFMQLVGGGAINLAVFVVLVAGVFAWMFLTRTRNAVTTPIRIRRSEDAIRHRPRENWRE